MKTTHSTTVRDILMHKGPTIISAPPDATVGNAVRKMMQANIGSLVVVEDQQILGIFTERDLLFRVVGPRRQPETTRLWEVMSSPVYCCHPDDDIRKCASLLLDRNLRHLVVAEEFGPVGMLSFRDLLKLAVAAEGPPKAAEALLESLRPI
jgi:CBS domain-containing protein